MKNLVDAYFTSKSHEEIARMVDITEIRENFHNLLYESLDSRLRGNDVQMLRIAGLSCFVVSIMLMDVIYVHNGSSEDDQDLASTIEAWQIGRVELKKTDKAIIYCPGRTRV